ncbi:MAG: hypothetical protein O7H39_19200, partial [Gammaproteobacteria bacterium]|nr:hypothetical protein [Gammaproteobacteria bacterium]
VFLNEDAVSEHQQTVRLVGLGQFGGSLETDGVETQRLRLRNGPWFHVPGSMHRPRALVDLHPD